jgi:hypothetical protein
MIERGDRVTIYRAGIGERGLWQVTGRLPDRAPDDQAYDIQHMLTGRRRTLREARLRPLPARRSTGARGRPGPA